MIVIDIKHNRVTLANGETVEADCSALAGAVVAVKDGEKVWQERQPFKGRENVDPATVDAIIAEAEGNQPRTVYDSATGEPLTIRQRDPIPAGYSDTITAEAQAHQDREQARAERDRRLTETDFKMLPDAPLTDTQRQAVEAYRQALRDWPETAGFPDLATIPAAP